MEFRREEILPGVFLTALRTDKFKTASAEPEPAHAARRRDGVHERAHPQRAAARHRPLPGPRQPCRLYGRAVRPARGARCPLHRRDTGPRLLRHLPRGPLSARERPPARQGGGAGLGELLLTPNTRGGLFLPDYVERERAPPRREDTRQAEQQGRLRRPSAHRAHVRLRAHRRRLPRLRAGRGGHTLCRPLQAL